MNRLIVLTMLLAAHLSDPVPTYWDLACRVSGVMDADGLNACAGPATG